MLTYLPETWRIKMSTQDVSDFRPSVRIYPNAREVAMEGNASVCEESFLSMATKVGQRWWRRVRLER
jgi:hypothetical protein